MRYIAAPAAVVLAFLAGCASTNAPSKAEETASASLQCRTGTYICRGGSSADKVQSVSPEAFRDSVRGRNPTGGR